MAGGWSVGVAADGRRVCNHCGTTVRSYRYRYYPPGSDLFERCVAFSWCSGCRVYSGNMAAVPRKRVLVDALAGLPPARRARLLGSEPDLIEFLDRLPETG